MATSTADDLVLLYTDTFIDQSTTETPYKLLSIAVSRFERLEAVAQDVLDLADINLATGVNLDLHGEKWQVFRQGKTDAEMRDAIFDQISIFYSGSTLPDFIAALTAFDAPAGSTITEVLPPEDAEANIFLNGATTPVFDRLVRSLNLIRGGAIELDITNAVTGDKLLLESSDSSEDNFLVHEDGNFILLE